MSWSKYLPASSAILLACLPKDNQLSESTAIEAGTSEAGGDPPDACGDGQTAPNEYCFSFYNVPSIVAPSLILSAQFLGAGPDQFAVFALAEKAATVAWKDDAVTVTDNLPTLSPAMFSKAIAVDVSNSPEPEIVFTHIWGAAVSQNKDGVLQPFVPLGLPDSAFAQPGHTIPIDIDGDAQTEYLKGSGGQVDIWRDEEGIWKRDDTSFKVPGCKILVDFTYGDFNADGLTDLAYIGNADTDSDPEACEDPAFHGVTVLLQSEVGGLTMMPIVSTGQHKFLRVESGDFDGDGMDDISALTLSDELLLFRSSGDGMFDPPRVVEQALAYIAGDVDGDGSSECVIFTKDTREVIIADDVFDSLKVTKIQGTDTVPLAVGDLNQDTVGDIAFLSIIDKVPLLTMAISNP